MTDSQTPPDPRSSGSTKGNSRVIGVLLACVAVGALVVAAVFVFQVDSWGENGNGLSERFQFDAEDITAVDPQLVAYAETGGVDTGMQVVRAVAAGAEGQIYVAGDQAVQVFDRQGQQIRRLEVSGEPTALAVAGREHLHPGRVYVGLASRVEVFEPDGESVGTWSEGLNEDSVLTSLAVSDDEVFVADAGNRVVLRLDANGRLIKEIGRIDEQRGIRGFVIPSPYFDIAVSADGLLRVVNPGARRIEAYTLDGDLLGHWGQATSGIEGFFGCCNPSHLAILADGRFATSEKGIPRVKVYAEDGEFESVVATSKMLTPNISVGQEIRDDHSLGVFDVAVDDSGRVFVLDPNSRRVRFFTPIEKGSLEDDEKN